MIQKAGEKGVSGKDIRAAYPNIAGSLTGAMKKHAPEFKPKPVGKKAATRYHVG